MSKWRKEIIKLELNELLQELQELNMDDSKECRKFIYSAYDLIDDLRRHIWLISKDEKE